MKLSPLFLLLMACSSDPPTEAVSSPQPIDQGWLPSLIQSPSLLDPLLAADQSGWVALHAANWQAKGNSAPTENRLREREAHVHGRIRRLAAVAWVRHAIVRKQRGDAVEAATYHAIAHAVALDAGMGELIPTLGAAQNLDPEGAALVALSAEAVPPETLGPRAACLARHRKHRPHPLPESGLCADLLTVAGLVIDPFAPTTQALSFLAPPLPHGFEGAVFSDRWTADGAPGQVPGLDLSIRAGSEATRDQIRSFDAVFDEHLRRWREAAPTEGQGLEADLALGPLARTRLLTSRAEASLDAGDPEAALAAALMAHDPSSANSPGPRNPPETYLVLAEARLHLGHHREALDALAPLRDTWPTLIPTIELVNDLVVLESLGRDGDSKEH
jgi:hypothetical protein